MNIRTAVIDDQDIICLGVQQSLASAPHITFLGGYRNLEEFRCSTAYHSVDVLLLDSSLPDLTFSQSLTQAQIYAPEAAIILLASNASMRHVRYALQAGASGVICKDEPLQDVLPVGIQYVYTGQIYLSPSAALAAGQIGIPQPLSTRLEQVLELMARGYHVQAICEELGVSRRSVYAARVRLRALLDVETSEQIVAEAIRRGLLHDEA